MRILHVVAGAEIGGAETFAQDAICGLAGRGVTQTAVCRPYPTAVTRFTAAGIAIEPLGFSWLDRVRGTPARIRRLARTLEVDLVHAWMSRATSFVPNDMPCPVIGWFGDYANLKYYSAADACIGVTPDLVRWTLRNGVAPHRAFLVNTFGTMPDSKPVRRSDLGVPQGVSMLLVLSRMHQVKGIDTMLHALTEVPDAFLCIAGDGPARAEYEELSVRLGLANRVRFLGWRDDRKALLEACDVCVLPSRYEPFGTVILEAWAARRPLVATRADGARQYVDDGETGLLCPIDDPPALAACLRRLSLQDSSLRDRLVTNGYRRYTSEFTQDTVLDRMLAVYDSVRQLGPRQRDVTVPIRSLDRVAIGRLAAGLAKVVPPDAQSRVVPAATVALAYAAANRESAATAGLIQLSGCGGLLRGSGGDARVLLLSAGQLAQAAAEIPVSAGNGTFAWAGEYFRDALGRHPGQPGHQAHRVRA